jgi:hypothetical protein
MKIVLFCSMFWIGIECFDHFKRNETELTTLATNAKMNGGIGNSSYC